MNNHVLPQIECVLRVRKHTPNRPYLLKGSGPKSWTQRSTEKNYLRLGCFLHEGVFDGLEKLSGPPPNPYPREITEQLRYPKMNYSEIRTMFPVDIAILSRCYSRRYYTL